MTEVYYLVLNKPNIRTNEKKKKGFISFRTPSEVLGEQKDRMRVLLELIYDYLVHRHNSLVNREYFSNLFL